MKILILNQAFYPDVVSTAQHASDLAAGLTEAGHQVTVICGRRGYDNPDMIFPARETWRDVKILRIWSTTLGKSAKWRRATDFATFILGCSLRLLFMPRVDAIISLTSPPLISFVAALAVPLKARHLFLWLMDINPDEAIAAGWLRPRSRRARCLSRMLAYSLHRADRIVVLDRFMKDRVLAKQVAEGKISVIPPWSHDDQVHFDARGRNDFRASLGLTNKFVVMYSGNHSPCHPLDTLMAAAERLAQSKDPENIVFCFIGGGSEFQKVQGWASAKHMDNVHCLPYQPLEKLSASLSAADLQVVVAGMPFVGIVHVCKIYNILAVGKRFLYIGPGESHITDIMASRPSRRLGDWCEHGDVEGATRIILDAYTQNPRIASRNIASEFSKNALLPRMIHVIERLATQPDKALAVELADERYN